MKKIIFIFLFNILGDGLKAQFLPNQYATLESNRSKGSKSLFYKLYKLSTTSVFPYSETEFDSYINTYGTFQIGGIANINTSTGTLNNGTNSAVNIINFTSTSELTSSINNTTPYSGYNGDAFAVIVSGYFIPKQTGTYFFTVEGDDAVDLFINNQNVASHYGGHGASALGTHTGSISLTAGKKYMLRGRMQECAGGEYFKIFWKKPSEANGSVWYQDAEELSTEEVLPNGLVMNIDPSNFYSFPRTGSTVFDLKGNVNGALAGNWAFNTSNQGVFVSDGDQDYVNLSSTPSNFPTGDISVFAWIKPTSLRNGWNIFLTKWFSSITGSENGRDFHLAIYPSGANYYQNLNLTNLSAKFGVTPITINNWYYFGFTVKNGVTTQLYINGNLDGPPSNSASRTNYTTAILFMGDPRSGNLLDFVGQMGSLQIYNRALSADEVFQNFNATKHRYGL